MKKILQLIGAVLISVSINAQTDIYFKMDHFLGNNPFAFNTAATNNLGNSFNVSRLQYYIAEIKIVHDGGQVTDVTNKWILVNANTQVNELLGNFNITTVEAVKFGIGVEQSYNHLDPSSYAMSHPLAPKSPSMHWGWSAGYRFVAMEGKSGSSLNQTYEFHALGDANYHTFTIQTAGTMNGSDITIGINADYEGALHNIDLSGGNNIIHGEVGKAADLLVNFSYNVFTSSDGNNSIGLDEGDENEDVFEFYPNPSSSKVRISGLQENNTVVVFDALGSIVIQKEFTNNEDHSINLSKSGVYFITILNQGEAVKSEKIVIIK